MANEVAAEVALAKAAVYQPGFESKASVKSVQVMKLQQLRLRRLEIKDEMTKSQQEKNPKKNKMESRGVEESKIQKQEIKAAVRPKKKQKLNWGLEVKRRWERKGNM